MYMPLNNSKLRIQWNEPWFFKLRAMGWSGWLTRLVLFVIGVLIGTGVLSARPERSPAPQLSSFEVLAGSAGLAVLFLLLLEFPTFQRVISIFETEIACVGAFMLPGGGILQLLMGVKQWNRREIKQIALLRTDEAGNPFSSALMIVTPKYSAPHRIAIPASISLTDLSAHIHAMDLPVELSDWNAIVIAADQSAEC
jgi:hypothetical protein